MQQSSTTTLSKGLQITLPSFARKALGLAAGDNINITTKDNQIVITKAETQEEQVDRVLRELDAINKAQQKNMTPEQKRLAKLTAGWTVNQFHEYFDNTPEHKAYIKEKYGQESLSVLLVEFHEHVGCHIAVEQVEKGLRLLHIKLLIELGNLGRVHVAKLVHGRILVTGGYNVANIFYLFRLQFLHCSF